MENEINEALKRNLKENYEKACNGYLVALLNFWEWDGCYGFWVSDVVGGTFIYGDDIALTMEDIIYCVENEITEHQYYRYHDYCLKCSEYNFSISSIQAYFNGCPQIPQTTFDKLDAEKKELKKVLMTLNLSSDGDKSKETKR